MIPTGTLRKTVWLGFEAVELASESVQVVVLPDLGCKVVSLKDKVSQKEWLYTDYRRRLRRLPSTSPFGESSLSGWDECFPAVAAGRYPGPAGVLIPDHGELWTQRWQVDEGAEGLSCQCSARALNYRFRRTISLPEPRRVRWSYALHNCGRAELVHGWSAHPLLAIGAGVTISIAEGPMWPEFGDGVRVSRGRSRLQGGGAAWNPGWRWPWAWNGNEASDLTRLAPGHLLTDKVFLESPPDGCIEVCEEATGAKLTFDLGSGSVPFVGVCSNAGASPKVNPQEWLAIEPTFASTDDLAESFRRGHVGRVSSGGTCTWHFDTLVG